MSTSHDPQATPNALAHATSPYLRQHMFNPVQWREWSPATLEEARNRNQPIFLSVGYSTCHWCHVMAHQSFEDQQVADLLNEQFIPIKVDREERPDIDEQYMLATQLMTQRGGWPNSVWLTPDGRPFFAGTYFSKDHFINLLNQIIDIWQKRQKDLDAQADRVTEGIRDYTARMVGHGHAPLHRDLIDRALHHLQQQYDPKHGGFGRAPKFPPHTALRLLQYETSQASRDATFDSAMISATLTRMARGGLFDQVGGGFARYSTDDHWLVPHFEKMLYDNAQLLAIYAEAYRAEQTPFFKQVIERTTAWLTREMRHAEGGFYSALDADSEGEEGKYYTWTVDEVKTILGDSDGELFAALHGFSDQGNWTEEATGEATKTNICHLPQRIETFAEARDLDPEAIHRDLPSWYEKLHTARWQRVHPHLDDKILTSWNGLLITGLAAAGEAIDEPDLIQLAEQSASFIEQHLTDDEGQLYRSWREGVARLPGYLDDYACLVQGLLTLQRVTGKSAYLDAAKTYADTMIRHFFDQDNGGFFYESDQHDQLLLRSKHLGSGGNTPSPNAVAILGLIRLNQLTGEARYARYAVRSLQSLSETIARATQYVDDLHLALAVGLDDPTIRPLIEAEQEKQTPPFSLILPDETIRGHAGQTLSTTVQLVILDDHHIAVERDEDEAITSGIGLKFAEVTGIALDEVHLPDPVAERLPGMDEPTLVYRGTISIQLRLAIESEVDPGEYRLPLIFSAQICHQDACLPIREVETVLHLQIVPQSG